MSVFQSRKDGTVASDSGKILLFSYERFVTDIVVGKCCFICGAQPGSKDFNDEHILPNWILRKYDLYNRTISLPNLSSFTYRSYTIPCCVDCNSLMGDHFEKRLSSVFEKGFKGITDFLKSEGAEGRKLLFNWLCLIFLKTHLKDGSLFYNRNRSSGDDRKISDMHNVGPLHHIHCLARSFYTGAEWGKAVEGFMEIFETKVRPDAYESFDFADLHQSFSISIRLGDLGIVAVLNDGGLCVKSIEPQLKVIRGPLSPVQLNEIVARISYFSTVLESRPEFKSKISGSGKYEIIGEWPAQVKLRPQVAEQLGEVMLMLCGKYLDGQVDEEQTRVAVKTGNVSFLMTKNGEFNFNSMEPLS